MKNLVSKIIRFEKKNPQYKKTITIMYCLLYVIQRVTDFMDLFIKQTQRIILKKQIVSLVLTFILVISMITQPISVYATDTTTRNTSPSNETNGDIPIDEEHFPDNAFRNWLSEQSYGKDGKITQNEIADIISINVSGKTEIKDLEGIEYFTALSKLSCDSTEISNLNVTKNEALEKLSCNDTEISNLDVSKNTNLISLVCSQTNISNLDISKNNVLMGLDCSNTKISNLDTSKNDDLEGLMCSNTKISKLDTSKNIKLTILICLKTNISTLDISKNIALETLNCSQTNISTLDLSKNTKLTSLTCNETLLNYLDISNNRQLVGVECDDTPLAYLKIGDSQTLGHKKIPTLSEVTIKVTDKTFNISEKFKGIDLTKINNLQGAKLNIKTGVVSEYSSDTPITYSYDCGTDKNNNPTILNVKLNVDDSIEINNDNFPDAAFREWLSEQSYGKDGKITQNEIADITSINVSGKTEIKDLKGVENFIFLKTLFCVNLGIESLDVSKNSKLTSLFCDNNQNLKSLNVKGATALEELYCNTTGISTLDVSENMNLSTLDCSRTVIESLDVSNHMKLTVLLCYTNENLNILNIQGATALEKLECQKTGISSLDVSTNTKLSQLYCQDTPLAYLNIGTNTTLSTLDISVSSINLEVTEDTFSISEVFPGIDPKMVAIISGAQYDSETGEVSEYKAGTSIRYSYNCGTVNGEEKTFNIILTLKGLKYESQIEITSKLDKAYDGQSVSTPKIKKTGSTGSVTYTWEMKKGNDWEKIESTPTDVGEYRVTAILEADDNYKSAKTEPVEFEISQATNSWKVALSIDNWTYREEANKPTSEAKFGEVKYTYSNKKDDIFTDKVPIDAGIWYVKATVIGTDNYKGIEATKDFRIYKAQAPDVTESENLSGVQNDKLSTVTLSGGWSWVEKDTVLKANNKGYVARLIVDDANYDYTGVAGYNQDNHYVERTLKVVVPKFENKWTVEPSIENWTYNEIASTPIGTAKHGTVIFTYSLSENGEFTKNKPTTAGTWYMKAYVPADDEYKELTSDTVEFKILKAENSNLKIISTPEELTTDYTGKTYDKTLKISKPDNYTGTVTFKWEKKKADGSWEELLSKPTDTGTYQVSAIASEDNNYQKTESEPVQFEIRKAESTITVKGTLDKAYDSNSVSNPTIDRTGSSKTPVYTWEKKNENDWEKLESAPKDVGEYRVKIDVSEDDNYKSATVTKEFTILQATNSWKKTLSIDNWTYKEEANVSTSEAKFGEVKYTYSDKQDGIFTDKVPTDAGTWYVKATVEGTDNYKGIEATKDFVIQKAEPVYTMPVNLNAVYGQTLGEIALDDGFEWLEPLKKVGDAGDVTVMLRYTPDDSNYKTVTIPVVIKVNRAENEWKVSPSIENWTYGEEAKKPISEAEFGEVKYTYSDKKEGIFTSHVPTNAGTWYVKAQVTETDNYTGLEEVKEFNINKAIPTVELPENLKGVEDQLLSTVILLKGWTWVDGNIMLSVQNGGYKARLIVDDTNYDYTGVEGYNKENHYVERILNVSVESKEAGSIQKEVKKGNNAPDVKISMTESQLANIVLTDEEKKAVEKGSDIKIVLTVDDATGQISIKDKTVIESVLGKMKIGQYLDVSLLKIIDHEESRISQTKGVIRITIEIPESLRKANRGFVMIRVHDGVATILKDLDTDANTITIETDQFSTYAIAYQDKQSNIAETEDRTVIGGYIILAGLSGMLLFINRKQKRI